MRSPLLKIALVVCGWPLALLALLWMYRWAAEAWWTPPPPPATAPVEHSPYFAGAQKAAAAFHALAPNARDALLAAMEKEITTLERWRADFAADNHDIVCIGEYHNQRTREFLAREFFSALTFDELHLEATAATLNKIIRGLARKKTTAPLLDADIAGVITAARARNPQLRISGIEETPAQRKARAGKDNRDASIAENFLRRHRTGRGAPGGVRQAILFGALHCADRPGWLFPRLRAAPQLAGRKLHSIRVLGRTQDGPLDAFVWFLGAIGQPRANFAISDTRALPPEIYRWFPLLAQTMRQFDALVVFSPGPADAK